MKKIKVCPETGLKIESTEDAKEVIEILSNNKDMYSSIIKSLKKEYGLNKETKIKRKEYFYKLYKNKYELFKELSPSVCKLFMFLLYNMNHNDNVVIVKDKHPTHKDLIELSGISDKSIIKGLNDLKRLNIIHVKNKGKYREIIINPYITEDTMTGESIYKLFE